MRELEAEAPMPDGFILPGATPASAALDLARAVTRRAERRCVALQRSGALQNPEVGRWLLTSRPRCLAKKPATRST